VNEPLDYAFPHAAEDEARRLEDVGADAEVDVVAPGTALSEFYRLSLNAIAPAAVAAGVLTRDEARAHADHVDEPDFLGCGFVHIGVWGRRPRRDLDADHDRE
jgi:hypothetical protein